MTKITIEATIKNKDLDTVWEAWTNPKDIVQWNNASEDWHSPRAENDVRIGGKFNIRMEAKDKSFGFDFKGKYTNVVKNKLIEYVLDDEREVGVSFEKIDNDVLIIETFDAENFNSIERQKEGWQSILNNFKKFVEN